MSNSKFPRSYMDIITPKKVISEEVFPADSLIDKVFPSTEHISTVDPESLKSGFNKANLYSIKNEDKKMIKHPFHGVITALITPFKNEEIDLLALEKIIEHQITCGIKNIIIAGSTGEGITLDFNEYLFLIESTLKTANGRLKVIAGSSASGTKQAISMLSAAEKLGVVGLMSTVPPYNMPSQEGLYQHFKAVHDATNLPIMLYANPGRSAADFEDATILRLTELPRIVALKDGDIERTLRLSAKTKKLALMSSDDITALSNRANGGAGVASVLSNILPREVIAIQKAWNKGDTVQALQMFQDMIDVCKAMFVESNPVPIKYAASLMGLCEAEMRLPLCRISEEKARIVEAACRKYI